MSIRKYELGYLKLKKKRVDHFVE